MSHFKTILTSGVVEETGFADLCFFRILCFRNWSLCTKVGYDAYICPKSI